MVELYTKTIIDYNKELNVSDMHKTNSDYACGYSLINDINKMRMIKAN